MTVNLVFLLCALLGLGYGQKVDLTRVEDSQGSDVVEAVINILRRSCIFSDDLIFLRRIAYADTNDGIFSQHSGGIWHINTTDFYKTVTDPSLETYRKDILKELYIDWSQVTYNDLQKPLYSAIATQLFNILKTGSGSYPRTINQQAALWSTYSTKNSSTFVDAVKWVEKDFPLTHQMDIVFILDSSASLSEEDFSKSKQFVRNFVSKLDVDRGLKRVAVVEFSSVVYDTVSLDNTLSSSRLLETISNIAYRPGGTNTNDALVYVRDSVFQANKGSRPNASKVVVLVTDGRSGDNVATIKAAQSLRETGVTIFAVGISSLIDERELSLVVSEPSCAHLKKERSYTELLTDSDSSAQLAMKAPVLLKPGVYEFGCSSDLTVSVVATNQPKTIQISKTDGIVDVYGSGSNAFIPNSAIYSFSERVTPDIPLDIYVRDGSQFFVSFRNHYTHTCTYRVKILIGDHLHTGNHKVCIQSGIVGFCTANDLVNSPFIIKGTVEPSVQSICANGETFIASYPEKNDRYLLCSSGKLIAVYCLPGQKYDTVGKLCVHVDGQTTNKVPTTTAMPAVPTTPPVIEATTTQKPLVNPCTVYHIASGEFIWPFPGDDRKYIKCGIFALSANVFDCGEHKYYSPDIKTCLYKDVIASMHGVHGYTFDATTNPCKKNYGDNVQYYPYPGDPQKFIQCDAYGDAYVLTCHRNEVWESTINNCIPTGFHYDTSGIVG